MPLELAEKLHRDMMETSESGLRLPGMPEQKATRAGLSRIFTRKKAKAGARPKPTRRKGGRRGDFVVAALGVTLGLICALFPWYIFYNPDQFGVRAIKLGTGEFSQTGPMVIGNQSTRVGAPIAVDPSEVQPLQLDLFATGTTGGDDDAPGESGKAPADQPFPTPPIAFKLVHVANGRAMIEDDSGLFVVQRGSALPDRSVVASIEQRDGRWVVVTSTDEVLELAP